MISFLLSIGVVYQHTQWEYDGALLSGIYDCFYYFIEGCVPLFFAISGYLFFRTYAPHKWRDKFKSRAKSLLLPYIIWNTIYAAYIIILSEIGLIRNAEIADTVWGVLFQLINAEFSPFWFIKYLMVFVLLSPIFYYVFKHRVGGALALTGMLLLNVVFYYTGTMQIPINVNANDFVMLNYQFIYYALGGYMALNFSQQTETSSAKRGFIGATGVLFLIVMYVVLTVLNLKNEIIGHGFRLIESCVLWCVADFIPTFKIYGRMKNSFFVYCSHLIVLQPAQRVCRIFAHKLGLGSGIDVLIYITMPLLTVVIVLFIGEILKRYLPRTWRTLNGGRG